MQALACLTSLANDFSVEQVAITFDTVEKVGRRLWTKPATTSPGPHATLATNAADNFWEQNEIAFPTSWPEKASIAVSIMDPDAWPQKYRLLNNDAVALSFWRYVGLAARLRDRASVAVKAAKRDKEGGQTPSPDVEECENTLRACKDLIDAAKTLQRNVPFSFIYCPDETFRYNEALSLREDVEFMREVTGLSGRGLRRPRSADRVSISGSWRGGRAFIRVRPSLIVCGSSKGASTRRTPPPASSKQHGSRAWQPGQPGRNRIVAGRTGRALACSAEAGTG